MTRTERSINPRAVIKDRSESKSGLDKSVRKNGGGPHNWGNLSDERAAMEDEIEENEQQTRARQGSVSSITEDDREQARSFRKGALKGGDIDLSAIARTSAGVSTSPPPPKTTQVTTDADTAASV